VTTRIRFTAASLPKLTVDQLALHEGILADDVDGFAVAAGDDGVAGLDELAFGRQPAVDDDFAADLVQSGSDRRVALGQRIADQAGNPGGAEQAGGGKGFQQTAAWRHGVSFRLTC
jgi:hypothetical protein